MNERSYETLLYSITASVVNRLIEMNSWSEDEALERFTSSKLYTYLEKEETKKIVHNFLTTEFEGGRHTRRVDIISNYDNNR